MARPRKNARTVTVDMEGVQSGGMSVPDGNYTAKIEEVEHTESKSSGEPMLVLKWRVTSKKGKGTLLYDNISLQPQALWRLKMLLEGLDMEVPDSSMDLDLDELEGQETDIQVTNETYEGKKRSRITAYGDSASSDEDAEEEDKEAEKPLHRSSGKPSKPSGGKSSKTSDDDEEEDEDDDAEDTRADNRSSHKAGLKKLKKGAEVRFKDEKNKPVKGTVISINGDLATVEDDDEEEWEVEVSELTVIG